MSLKPIVQLLMVQTQNAWLTPFSIQISAFIKITQKNALIVGKVQEIWFPVGSEGGGSKIFPKHENILLK